MTPILQYEENIIKNCFNDKKAWSYCISRITDPKVFTDPICQLLYNVFLHIHDQKIKLHMGIVKDVLKKNDCAAYVDDLERILETQYDNSDEYVYQIKYLLEVSNKTKLLGIISDTHTMLKESHSSDEMVKHIQERLLEVEVINNDNEQSQDLALSAFKNLEQMHQGKTKAFLKTGWDKFDEIVSLSKDQWILIPAS